MEVVLGALPSLLPKLGELLADEYNLQKEVKGGIRFLQAELESMKGALEDISSTPPDKLSSGDKIWARNVRELTYDIEDNIDAFVVQVKGHQPAEKKHGFKEFIKKTIGFSLMQPKIRRKIAINIRDIKNHVKEVHELRGRYTVKCNVDKPVKVDPRALVRYEKVTELVGIEKSRYEVIKILFDEGNQESKQQNNIVSIVGFGGLGKTTLANLVYEMLRSKFDCSAFVSVSQTPDMLQLFKDIFYKLDKEIFKELAIHNVASVDVIISELSEFLQQKRYFIIIDDICEVSHWNMIKCALPDNNVEYRIITTTRNFTVAELIGRPYKMKPLSPENSRLLMYGRIFGKEVKDKCPVEQLEEVSNRILKKCDGVPLAIITIASLLVRKGRSKLEWYELCNSIGAGLDDSTNAVENMRKVLSLSYYDMPSHLRTCLLYLSMFPEDYDIRKVRLIWLWIAEGFIQSKKQDKSLFEIGENYLNELINRSMIQPKYDTLSGMIESCRVHDMVLDLICSLSSEENFITTQNNMDHTSTSKKVRRLSLQNGKASHAKHEATLLSKEHHVRSFLVFQTTIEYITTVLANFSILRVLDLQGCDLSQSNSLKYLGNLLHLRYLSLRYTVIDQLPEELGNLQFLQILDIRNSGICSLPSSTTGLTQLKCLNIDSRTIVPKGIRMLTDLEELSILGIEGGCKSIDIVEELGHLAELRVLEIDISEELRVLEIDISEVTNREINCLEKSLVECLNKLHKIQNVTIFFYNKSVECNLDGWVVAAPQHLRSLEVPHCLFSALPGWLNPSLVRDLSILCISVKVLRQEDLEILGSLPALCILSLRVHHEDPGIHGRFVLGACSSPCLRFCNFCGFGVPLVFQQGAMPRLLELCTPFPVQRMREISGSFDLGLGNLPSLEEVNIWFSSEGAGEQEVEEAKAALRHAIEVHPNHPRLDFY